MFSFAGSHQILLRLLYDFIFTLGINESAYCSTSLSVFGIIIIPDFGHSHRCVVVSHCFNLMAYDVEQLFIFLCVICISSLMTVPWRSLAHFSVGLFALLLLSLKILVYLDNSPLSDVFLQIFSPSLWLFFCFFFFFLDNVFCKAEVLNFNGFQVIHYFFLGLCLGVVSKKSHHHVQGHLGFLLHYLLEVL